MANGANTNTQLGPVYTKIGLKASTQSRQDKGELGNMSEQHGTTLGTASSIFNRLEYYTENGGKANILSEIQKRGLQGQRQVAKDNEKTVTGETFDRPQEVILDTRPCASDTCVPERDTLPKQGDNDKSDSKMDREGTERPGQAGTGLGTWVLRLTSRTGERCARHGLLREQRQGNRRAKVRHRQLRGMYKTTAEKTDTGETFDRPQEVILDTRPCASDTCAPERATLPKQGDNAGPDATGKHSKKPTTAH